MFLAIDAKQYRHYYNEGDQVRLFYNNVGPYYNPTEVYPMSILSFCKPGMKLKFVCLFLIQKVVPVNPLLLVRG